MEQIRYVRIEAGVLTMRTPINRIVDRSFIPSDIWAAEIDVAQR